MKRARSLVLAVAVALALVSLLIIGIPTNGFAGTPHACKLDLSAYQPENLGGVTTHTFTIAKDCPPDNSQTTAWKWHVIRSDNNIVLCSGESLMLPPDTVSFKCAGLPVGKGKTIAVIIDYKTSSNGSWLTHTEWFVNCKFIAQCFIPGEMKQ